MNILSLFDGMSCGRIALERAEIPVTNYYASEIDKYAIQVSKANWPDIQHLGDIRSVSAARLPKIDLLIGGSPCQGFSFAGKQLNFDDPRSALFFEYIRLKNELDPKWFLLENVVMKPEYEHIISDYMGVDPVMIDSRYFSAQVRKRLYWTNIPIGKFWDSDKILEDILEEPGVGGRIVGRRIDPTTGRRSDYSTEIPTVQRFEEAPDGKMGCLTTVQKDTVVVPVIKRHGELTYKPHKSMCLDASRWRKLTPVECERLQTVPDNYTASVSNTQRYKMLGNGWTVDVIAHIFKGIKGEKS